jgi:hypothetical protein
VTAARRLGQPNIARTATCLPAITSLKRRPPIGACATRIVAFVDSSDLFYGWLFRDADAGTHLERASALRHNREQSRWLPVYLLRWSVIGGVLIGLETQARALNALTVLSAALALALIYVAVHLMLTMIFWAFLRGARR